VASKIRELMESDPCFSDLSPQIPSGLESTVEETALAVEALATVILRNRDQIAARRPQSATRAVNSPLDGDSGDRSNASLGGSDDFNAAGNEALQAAILRGIVFLMQSVKDRRHRVAWPIGFYFAKLWYHERLYPLIFTAAAFGKFLRATDDDYDPNWPR
jgi:squalene-hopene/tetraprenyl-beta-curcumene cyclase